MSSLSPVEASGICRDRSGSALHLSVCYALGVCTTLVFHQGGDGNVQAGARDPVPFLPTPPRSWAPQHGAWASC